jgi:imidazolonepropionase-like amidohydrolase
MPSDAAPDLLIRAARMFNGTPSAVVRDAAVWLRSGRIRASGSAVEVLAEAPAGTPLVTFPAGTILPGFIDVHAHVTFGTGARSYEDVMRDDTNEDMVVRGIRNCALHLAAGVTTLRDCGSRDRTALVLREGAAARAFPSPRLLASGPPITPTRGHFWWCNGEADGIDGVRVRAEQLIREGVDFLKIMASGGGTKGTDPTRASYGPEVIAAAVQVAHRAGRLTTAHCLSADGLANASDGGIDQVEHINFMRPDGSRRWMPEIAERIIERGIVVSPTIQTGYRELEALRALERSERTPEQWKELDALERKLASKLDFVRRFDELGAPIVAGTDAIQRFGDYAIGLELLAQAGMSPVKVLASATSGAAKAIGLDEEIGSIGAGREADVVVVDGDPTVDIGVVRDVRLVVRGGRIVHRVDAAADPILDSATDKHGEVRRVGSG